MDPKTGNTAVLFNPRTADWSDHFAFTVTWRVRGRTDTGRATIEALGMNRTAIAPTIEEDRMGGRVYATSLSLLTLEVYYRHKRMF